MSSGQIPVTAHACNYDGVSIHLECPVCTADEYGNKPLQGALISRTPGRDDSIRIIWTCEHRKFGGLHTGYVDVNPRDLAGAVNNVIDYKDFPGVATTRPHPPRPVFYVGSDRPT
jgi:hypothetical protein